MPSIRDMSCHDIVVKIVVLHPDTGEYKEGDCVIIQEGARQKVSRESLHGSVV